MRVLFLSILYQIMPNIEVTIASSNGRPTYCLVVITNCDARHYATERINERVSAHFVDVPPGKYYIVMVPEGGNARQMKFRVVDEATESSAVTFSLSAAHPVGRITAIVLVGGQRAPGIVVTLKGKSDEFFDQSMTDINGVVAFESVPETQAYDLVAHHGSAGESIVCDLVNSPDFDCEISFP